MLIYLTVRGILVCSVLQIKRSFPVCLCVFERAGFCSFDDVHVHCVVAGLQMSPKSHHYKHLMRTMPDEYLFVSWMEESHNVIDENVNIVLFARSL